MMTKPRDLAHSHLNTTIKAALFELKVITTEDLAKHEQTINLKLDALMTKVDQLATRQEVEKQREKLDKLTNIKFWLGGAAAVLIAVGGGLWSLVQWAVSHLQYRPPQ